MGEFSHLGAGEMQPPPSFLKYRCLLSVSLASASAAYPSPLGNVETLLQGPHIRPEKSRSPRDGERQREFLRLPGGSVSGQDQEPQLVLHPFDQPTDLPPAPCLGFTCQLLPHLRSHVHHQVPGLPTPARPPSWAAPGTCLTAGGIQKVSGTCQGRWQEARSIIGAE